MSENFLRQSGTLNELLGYLDSVESTVPSDFVLPDLSQAQELHSEFVQKIDELSSTLDDTKQREMEARQELKKVKEDSAKEIENLKMKQNKKLQKQKQKYEEQISKYMQMMDSIIKEKESLAREVEMMTKRVTVAREEAARREKEIHDQAAVTIAQQRELAIAQEKARQKKYLQDRENEIKDLTAKGMQSQIENLIMRQKREIEAIKSEKEE